MGIWKCCWLSLSYHFHFWMPASNPCWQGWWIKSHLQSVHNLFQLFHKLKEPIKGAFVQFRKVPTLCRMYLDCDMTSAGTSARHLLGRSNKVWQQGPAGELGDLRLFYNQKIPCLAAKAKNMQGMLQWEFLFFKNPCTAIVFLYFSRCFIKTLQWRCMEMALSLSM